VYVSPALLKILPIGAATLLHIVGIVEIVVGVAMLTRWLKISAYIAAVWLTLIALNLITTGRFLDIAVRDLVMAIAAFVLGQLTSGRGDAR
jgi:hypothetical protein